MHMHAYPNMYCQLATMSFIRAWAICVWASMPATACKVPTVVLLRLPRISGDPTSRGTHRPSTVPPSEHSTINNYNVIELLFVGIYVVLGAVPGWDGRVYGAHSVLLYVPPV